MNQALELFAKRRTQYALGKNVSLPQSEIEQIIKQAIRLAPSAFNSQSSRAVILFGAESVKFWDATREILRGVTPADKFDSTSKKMDSFAAGVGTVLFFEDQDTVKKLQADFPLYADAFPKFAEHSAGIAQFAVWTALAAAGIGASLQHYSPLVDEMVQKTWNVPASWQLSAQMPFGSNEAPFGDKSFIDDSIRFKTFAG